ncbi:MAG: PASTA domain-containing protein [Terracidiphilus sp.]
MFQGVGFPARRIPLVSALILGAVIVSQAQQPLLTRHVRQETLNGHAPLVGRLPAAQSMRLTLVLPHRNEAELQALLKDLYDPSSPSYRKFLTVEEFTARFGPSQEDYDAVTRFAEANGLTVVGTSRNRMNVDVTGPVENVEAAFHVTMGTYQHPTENRTFFAPDREPTPDLGVQLWHIAGLDNYSTPKPNLVRRDASAALNVSSGANVSSNANVSPGATTGTGPSASYLGSDMRAAYYVNGNPSATLTGAGQSVGLFEFLGTDLADLATYYTNTGQTNNVPITLKSVDTQSTSCVEHTCDDTEQTLDMTEVLGMAPGLSSLVMYIGTGGLSGQTLDDAGILNAMATASPLNAQLSSAWAWKPADPTTDDVYFEEFAAQGQTFFAASGDDGNWSHAEFVWPADSVYVTSVGGTDLTTTGAAGPWASETGWEDSGGGIGPDDFPIPSWQTAAAAGCAECSQTFRNGPDVAANADFTFYVCADQFACSANLYGGTSFAASIWAGYMALVNQQAVTNCNPPLGFINPALYTIGLGVDYDVDFHDITSGGNTLGATIGYDLSTGWGSPNGSALINALAGAQSATFCISASPTSVSVAQGMSGTSTITTAIAGGFASSIALSATGQPTGVTASFNPTSIVAPGSGSSTLTLTVASNTATGIYPITVTGTSGSLTPSTTVTLTVIGAGQVAVPNVVGDTQAAATTAITGAGLAVGTVTTVSSSTVPSGDVISQSPGAGTGANPGSAVNIVVASGSGQSTTAATPVFSPAAGTYPSAQSVTITDSTNGATIYFTTNGTTPTTSSPQYNGAIVVSATETLEAIAVASGFTQSATATASYTIGSPGSDEWTWMSGSSLVLSIGVYGTLGTPAAGNVPGARDGASTWADGSGHLWLFGGEAQDYNGNFGYMNDLWEFAPSTSEWTWMGGNQTIDSAPVYGTLGTPAAGNTPGGRLGSATWTDGSGNFWLFGGGNLFGLGAPGYLNDLWEFNPSSGEWTWRGGSSTAGSNGGQPAVYGTLGTPAAGNIPGGREYGASWTDNEGNFWLFGGSGMDANGAQSDLNDLWEFTPSTGEWTWMGGSSTDPYIGQPGVYGTKGTPAAGNIPGGRYGAVSWTDSGGNFWLFGGDGYDVTGTYAGQLNDLWEFTPSTGYWTWMGGSSTFGRNGGQPGVYGTLGTPAAGNIPGGRSSATSWTDRSGNFWLFGGYGYDEASGVSQLDDLWEFSPSTSLWTWMGGTNQLTCTGTLNVNLVCHPPSAVYGTLGTAAAPNIPGGRQNASAWTDSSGNFWFFGGGTTNGGSFGDLNVLNDLWRFQTAGSATSGPTPAATPTFNLASGTYSTAQIVSISDATAGAAIYYTTNGDPPTILSTLYNGAINVSATETIEAIAVASGYGDSAVASATYTIQVNVPIQVGVPNVVGDTQAAATTAIAAAQLVVGTVTTQSSGTVASGDVISQSPGAGTAVNPGSAVNLVVSTGPAQVATPNFSVAAGTYSTTQTVIISDATVGAIIYYTTNGTTPTTSSAVYSCAISVSSTETLEAIAAAPGDTVSAVANAAYTITSTGTVGGVGEWTWEGGICTVPGANEGWPAAYGTLGTPAAGNTPGGTAEAASWTDSNGNFWLLGGAGSALWELNPSTKEWAWTGGSGPGGSTLPVYGTLGTPAPGNFPGVRGQASTWTDGQGNLWLFGGIGPAASATNSGELNDLWKFNTATNEWAWISGSNTAGGLGGCYQSVYGAQGTPAPANVPAFRAQAANWIDLSGHLWLYGGLCTDTNGTASGLSDLWEFDPSISEWTFVGGSAGTNVPASYGTKGTPAAGNLPGWKHNALSWTDRSGNFWLFGGDNLDDNVLWEYSPSTKEWEWVTGSHDSSAGTEFGVYGALKSAAPGNTPGARISSASWTDSSGNFWLFGGIGIDNGVSDPGPTGQVEGLLNDLWEFSPSTNEWTWMGGNNSFFNPQAFSFPGVYGSLGLPSASNLPGSRVSASAWTDANGNLWLFGGLGPDANGTGGTLNDLWKYQLNPATTQVSVPNVVGDTQAAATTAITGAGLVVGTVTTASSPTVASGNVISETPIAGTSVSSGSAVNLVISTGPAQVAVPNVVGDTQAAATTAITGAGLVVGTVTTASSPTVASGKVISESPSAGTSVASGSAVNLVVSTGPAQVAVPNVVGVTQAAATTAITGAGLVVGTITTASSSTVASGNVISESPVAGTSVNSGSAVNLVVSTGPAQVTVPNVVGVTQAAASTAITGAGLVVGTVTTASSSTVPSGNVISESPVAGTSVNSGSAVNLVVSTGLAQVTVPNVVGVTQAAATSAILAAGLTVGTVSTASSSTVASGNVISESPAAGTSVSTGSAVNLVVSTGPAQTPSYTLSANPSSLTIKSGSSASTVITLTPTGGFTGTVNFACGTLPTLVTCAFVPTSLTVTSSSPLTTTLTIGTTGTTMAYLGNQPAGTVLPTLLAALILLPLGFMRRVRRTRKAASLWLGLLLLAGTCLAAASLLGTAGCGGGSASTPPGAYSIPITVTSGSTTVPLNLSITIQ